MVLKGEIAWLLTPPVAGLEGMIRETGKTFAHESLQL